jgi:predicted ATPase
MVDRVVITAFKRIDKLDLQLGRPATVLLGGNNSGKSSVLEAIHLAVSAAQAVRLIGAPEWQEDGFKTVIPQERLTSARVDIRNSVRSGRQETEVAFFSDDLQCTVLLAPRLDTVEITLSGALVGEQVMALEPPFCIYVPGLSGIPLRETAIGEGAVRRAIARGDSNLVLRNVLVLLKSQTAAWLAFNEDLRGVFPDSEFEIHYAAATDEVIHVRFRHGDGSLLPLENAGTGVLQCIQLLAYARLFKPRILLLDEPDAHLHATNQRRLCRLLLALAEEHQGSQILLATHSRHIVSALQRDARLCWMRSGELSPSDPADLVAGLLELGALDDGEKLAGRTLKCVVLTEDEDQTVIEPLLWSSGFVEAETLVLSYRGCTNHVAVAALCQTFADRLPGARIVVHRDRDYNDADEVARIERNLEKASAIPFVTDGPDAETYYLRSLYLVELGVTKADADTMISQAREQAKPESLRKMINCRVDLAIERRRRERDAPSPDPGRIAAAAQAELEGSLPTLCHGKEALGRLRELLQERGVNPNPFFKKSDVVRIERLEAVARTIWPASGSDDPGSRQGSATAKAGVSC